MPPELSASSPADVAARPFRIRKQRTHFLGLTLDECIQGFFGGNAFVAVYVKEDDGSPFRIPLKVRAVLTSPAGANFDLVMYAEQDGCGAVTDASYTEFSDTVTTTWDEAFLSADDSRTVIFEIKHVSGECSEAFPWTLEVQGNN